MALINCPKCKEVMIDTATECPKCGHVLGSKVEGTQKKGRKKIAVALVAVCVVIVAAMGVAFGSGLFAPNDDQSILTAESITVGEWRQTESPSGGYWYVGTVVSERKSPFVAIFEQYYDGKDYLDFVYVEDGKGVIEPYLGNAYAIGYLTGTSVDISDIKVQYEGFEYSDFSHSNETSCSVLISVDMNNAKNGLFIFEVVNETTNITERNMVAVVINGKAEYNYYSTELPYKTRDMKISIVPKLFIESAAVAQEDYAVKKAFTAETDYILYTGEETLTFANYADGVVLYTKELKEGGDKENLNIVRPDVAYLRNGECTFKTYDYDLEGKSSMPKYEFKIIGYIAWTPYVGSPGSSVGSGSSHNSSSSSGSGSFTNKYGTSTTKCAVSGCNNYIARSGDTNCCTTHSNRCLGCRCYIDSDATYCMSCIYNAANGSR